MSPPGGEYESGLQVTLTATPASGYTFDYWDGSASSSSPTVTITMNSNKSIAANFKAVKTPSAPTPTLTPTLTPTAALTPTLTPTPLPSQNVLVTESTVKDNSNKDIVGGDGHTITLKNYFEAKDPTYQQLLTFLKSDKTDEIPYETKKFTTPDFAETLHNNAEKAGLRCAYVIVEIDGLKYALNAFETTDRGIVYIDVVGLESGQDGPKNMDAKVDIQVGYDYATILLFPDSNWNTVSIRKGTITKIVVIQWW